MKGQLAVVNAPLLRKVEEFPFSAALFAAVIVAIRMLPSAVIFWGIPDDLRVRTYQKIVAPALQLFAAGGINHFIIFPFICYPHMI